MAQSNTAQARAESFAQGWAEAYVRGHGVGHAEGFSEGFSAGHIEGYDIGHCEGRAEGLSHGHDQDFKEGHPEAESYTDCETVAGFQAYAESYESPAQSESQSQSPRPASADTTELVMSAANEWSRDVQQQPPVSKFVVNVNGFPTHEQQNVMPRVPERRRKANFDPTPHKNTPDAEPWKKFKMNGSSR